jgi:pyruvate dehydrogenase E1 component alpha subunit
MGEKESKRSVEYQFFSADRDKVCNSLGQARTLKLLEQMLSIRNFEVRAESAYQQGKVGGFFHAYIGQEAVQTAAVGVMGLTSWWITSYRCHALALLLGATPDELMAELYGKATGNAKGRGGSMHFYTERLLGGFGIVGGQIPIAAGAAFTIKYLKQDGVAVCFIGDGAVAQGLFHETLNLAALWNLPLILVIENNNWGMGTAVERAISVEPIAMTKAPAYGIAGYTFNGMDIFNCYAGFAHVYEEVRRTSRPVLVEVITERFRGHSISDPAAYRSKQSLAACMEKDPISAMLDILKMKKWITDEGFQEMNSKQKERILSAMEYAEASPLPSPVMLGEDVFAPESSQKGGVCNS